MLKYLAVLGFTLVTLSLHAQTTPKDSSAQFKVSGECGQCQQRIETAAKIKGVRSASWNVESKLFSVVFDPKLTDLSKIQARILAAGHDVENAKANDAAYDRLPACCHYREQQSETTHPEAEARDSSATGLPGSHNNGLPGSPANGPGHDSLTTFGGNGHSVAKPATLSDSTHFKHLEEVSVTHRQKSTYLPGRSPIRTQIITDRELTKAACCNLSESFETNPSVDVSYNDAVTGSKQIQLLGLSGNYTQLTVENLPGPRGIATPLGLNSIAGPWIESIQLIKGIGSVANGYESIAGQINVELKKPETSEALYANGYVNEFGKTDLNLNLAHKLNAKWSTALLLHDDFLTNKKMDVNKDGFRDLPTGNQFNLVNRWKYDNGQGWMTQFGVKVLTDRRTGGQVDYNPGKDKFSTSQYGLGINTDRYEGFAKIGYVFPEKYKSLGLQLSAFDHRQNSYFGLTTYDAHQQNLYGNFIYQSIINNTSHQFRTGLSFLYDNYDEDLNAKNYQRKEVVPGAFFEYTYSFLDKFNVVAGIRGDHNSLFGFFVTPRLHVRYEPVKGTTIRVSAGRGQRTANIFAENTSVFVSARQVNIIGAANGKAYGLNPEVAWNKGITLDQKFRLFSRDASISLDYFRNDFTDQVVVDLENPREVRFYNLKEQSGGKSYSNSLQAELNLEPLPRLDLKLAWRYFDVKTTYGGTIKERPLISANRAFANLAYATGGWKFDYTIQYNGRKRIPGTEGNPPEYVRGNYSPDFTVMNAQISRSLGKKHPVDLYIGAENLTNFIQKDAIIAADQPFSRYFDASMVWGPITGRMIYGGFRFKLK